MTGRRVKEVPRFSTAVRAIIAQQHLPVARRKSYGRRMSATQRRDHATGAVRGCSARKAAAENSLEKPFDTGRGNGFEAARPE